MEYKTFKISTHILNQLTQEIKEQIPADYYGSRIIATEAFAEKCSDAAAQGFKEIYRACDLTDGYLEKHFSNGTSTVMFILEAC